MLKILNSINKMDYDSVNDSSAVEKDEKNLNVPFRVRNVSEINLDLEYTSTPKKRKLPTWLTNSSRPEEASSSDNKRHQTEKVIISSSKNSISNLHEENINNKENETIGETTKNTNDPKLETPNKITMDNKSETNNRTIEKTKSNSPEYENVSALPNKQDHEISDKNLLDSTSLPKPIKVKIKEESIEETMSASEEPSSSTLNIIQIKKESVKEEPSSTTRESCKYGIRCYRNNPQHRIQEAHPGDTDYRRPNYPTPPKGTPDCPFGSLCYRRNPRHFQDFSHPPSTDFKKNYLNYKRRRLPKTTVNYTIDSDEESDDDFIDDGSDDDFVPTDDSDDEDFE